MNNTLTQAQKDGIREALLQHDFSAASEISKLMEQGYEEAEAKGLLVAELKAYKKEIFDRAMKRKNLEERRKGLSILVFMIAIIGPVFEISSPLWYVIVVAVSGICGYFAYTDKPVAGVLAAVFFPIVLPFTYNWYLSGRTSFLRIEMLIPVGIALIPSFVIYFLLTKTLYANSETH